MNWNAVAGIAGVGAAIVAAVALYIQNRQTSFIAGVELLLRMDDKFDSPEMLRVRREAARGLLNGHPEAAEPIMRFFEVLGLLVHKGALDASMVWNDLSEWIIPYVEASSEYIEKSRRVDKSYWSEALWLANRMREIERKRMAQPSLRVPESQKDFLTREADLTPKSGSEGTPSAT